MKIKIGSSWFEPTTQAPVMVVMTPKEKSDIANMAPDATMYAVFNDDCGMSSNERLNWMTQPDPATTPEGRYSLLAGHPIPIHQADTIGVDEPPCGHPEDRWTEELHGETKQTQEYLLRAMAENYDGGHIWDRLDTGVALKAADEICALRAELLSLRRKVEETEAAKAKLGRRLEAALHDASRRNEAVHKAERKVEEQRRALASVAAREQSILADLRSAHHGRGPGASSEMRSADRDDYEAAEKMFTAARALAGDRP